MGWGSCLPYSRTIAGIGLDQKPNQGGAESKAAKLAGIYRWCIGADRW